MKPLTSVLKEIKPRQKVMLKHRDGALYKVTANNNLSGEGLWAIDYSYWNFICKRFEGPCTGGYFPANQYDVVRISGRFV